MTSPTLETRADLICRAAVSDPAAAIKVLIVDDHEMVAESFRRVLAAAGIEVVAVATTAETALKLATEHAPDVVVMDYGLPDGDGVTTAVELRKRCSTAKVLMLTGGGSAAVLDDALNAGLSGYVEKTSALESLVDAVRSVARGDVVVSSNDPVRIGAARERGRSGTTSLTRREREVLELVGEGLSNQVIADRLTLSLHTVRTHVQTILRKLDAHSKLEAVAIATRTGRLTR